MLPQIRTSDIGAGSLHTYCHGSGGPALFSIANSLQLTESCCLSEKPFDERFQVPVDEVYYLCDELHDTEIQEILISVKH